MNCATCGESIPARKIAEHVAEKKHKRIHCPAGCGKTFTSMRNFHSLFGLENGHICWEGPLLVEEEDLPPVEEGVTEDGTETREPPPQPELTEGIEIGEAEEKQKSLWMDLFSQMRNEGLKHESLDLTAQMLGEIMGEKKKKLESALRNHSSKSFIMS